MSQSLAYHQKDPFQCFQHWEKFGDSLVGAAIELLKTDGIELWIKEEITLPHPWKHMFSILTTHLYKYTHTHTEVEYLPVRIHRMTLPWWPSYSKLAILTLKMALVSSLKDNRGISAEDKEQGYYQTSQQIFIFGVSMCFHFSRSGFPALKQFIF